MNPATIAAANAAMPSGALGDKVKTGLIILVVLIILFVIFIAVKTGANWVKGISDTFSGFFEAIGLKADEDDKKANADVKAVDEKANSTTSPFNPTFYKTAPAGTALMTTTKRTQLAHQIYDSVGIMYDDPESGLGAIKQCTNWCMVSLVADKFNELFGKDLYDWLRIKYDTTKQKDTLAKMVNYSFSLPKYTS
jgi:hypothetical protein